MLQLALAIAAFVGLHFLLSAHPLRGRLIARLGEGPFRGLYSLLAAATLVWSAISYNRAPVEPLWSVPAWLGHLPVALMPLAVLLFVGSLTQPNPTLAGRDRGAPAPAGGVLAITRHPMLWSFAIWAILHVLANGDLASLIFFGGLALLSIGGAAAIDARKRRQWPAETWNSFAAATSFLPFAALLAGRARLRAGEIGWWRLLLAAALFAALLALHPTLFGVSPVPMG
jgi:uncharacterized membrane protein